MGKQTGFYAAEEDFTSLLDFTETLDVVIIPEIVQTGSRVKATCPTRFKTPESPELFYLIPKELSTAEAFYVELPTDRKRSKLNSLTSPVIELSQGELKGDQIFDSRVYLGLDSGDPRYPLAAKKYQRIAQFIKKWERIDEFNFYVAPKAAELARTGAIRLMHHQIELHVT